ncbi:MAG TPA: wax ester/triacylglycerol synthase family O-acyltransferase [Candidatus Limnocylindria bacterium]|nr:wax ester/triacylglycerol synthase family O-acyltransferase [Candidatus Limnocylindria bacterium]
MERLPGIDASFLYMETPAAHTHTIKVAVVEPATDAPYSLERVRNDLAARLHLLPPFRRRLVEVPWGLHHPLWIEDPTFDLSHHVRETIAPAPGGPRELDAVVSAIASEPLDRRRPLWELWMVRGLVDDRLAAVAKIHHAVADGVAVAALLANVLQPGAEALAPCVRDDGWRPELVPSPAALVRDAVVDRMRQTARLPPLVARTVRNLRGVTQLRRTTAVPPPRPVLDAPRTSLNGALTARRAFASTALPLADVRAMKAAHGATINDVLLSLVGGAVCRYLAARGEHPDRPLVAEVPVATDPPGARRIAGNRLSNIFTSLCTDVADPVARLRAVHDAMATAKRLHETLGPDLYEAWTEFVPPRPFSWAVRTYSRWRLADRHRPPINVIVSCVPGPRVRLGWSGGTLEALYSVGPIIEGAALNVTAWSYADRLCVGVLSCPDLLPDPHVVSEGLHAELEALMAATPPTG